MADDRLIPDGIHDISAEGFNAIADRLGTLDLTVLLVYIIDHVPASVLPHLARQFHVLGYEGWAVVTTEAQQRALLKAAFELHRYRGTPWAIETALSAVGIISEVVEWFDYEGTPGDPFHFKVIITGGGLTTERIALITSYINCFKNVRSWLDAIEFVAPAVSGPVYVAGVVVKARTVTVYPYEEA